MNAEAESLGIVTSVWRYPVKSMQGEELREAILTERGILGDRAYALRDRETGHIASAKHPRKWGSLLACRAAFVESPLPGRPLPPVFITLPDGAVISSAQPDVDRHLSRAFGREVTLVAEAPPQPTREADRSPIENLSQGLIREEAMALAAPPGTLFDYAPLHLLTTTTLDRLRALSPASDFDARRFRPNLLVTPTGEARGFVENGWLGGALMVGAEVCLKLIDPCPRCVVTTLPQAELPRDTGILRTLAQNNPAASMTLAPGVLFPAVAGVYATVLQGGVLRRGDALHPT